MLLIRVNRMCFTDCRARTVGSCGYEAIY
jgi:hypothetical protein